jgi:hypothetical protein
MVDFDMNLFLSKAIVDSIDERGGDESKIKANGSQVLRGSLFRRTEDDAAGEDVTHTLIACPTVDRKGSNSAPKVMVAWRAQYKPSRMPRNI